MIRLSDVSFAYQESDRIVEDLCADFAEGSLSALVGKSGSGKSTVLYLIGQMLRVTSGTVTVGEVSTTHLSDWERAELRANSMGFVFQDSLLDPARSILDNVTEGGLYHARRSRPLLTSRAVRLLQEFDVSANARRRPGQISGGQAQRVALCRAFVTDPPIVLADEPTGNLDRETADVVWRALRARADRGGIVIVATHDRSRSSMCDQVVEVGRGTS